MKRHIIKAWLQLLFFEYVMRCRGFNALHIAVKRQELYQNKEESAASTEELVLAMDYACVFYFKPVLCLQRSAATAVQLRRNGHNAEMVIGAQLLPFKSHAWVEIGPNIVNDKPYICDIYQPLERC